VASAAALSVVRMPTSVKTGARTDAASLNSSSMLLTL
jgi:hypothetical protein